MVCAIQWVERKGMNGGANYGGYIVNDGTHTVFVNTGTRTNTLPLYIYLGIGDTQRGEAVYQSSLIMPCMVLSPAIYNGLVGSMPNDSQEVFKGE